ncbi:SRPBCC family protein [Rhizobiaceae bacterium n13]|uniref:SRPBCC family protein n=1 Tax=Ferirhizobium litorale TaxID=2927786 RepID=A0AAE3QF53_9HYPH|nr:SRPBCC family protein [Fererhizobium litorale]MDI7861634.1 SRPBCC family protein [Fererhizobium litorale]MDI7922024.1 SRPBCC family protein [Fererhizobium litorale]
MAKVTVSSVITAPVEKVWERIRDFNGLPSWHPRMVKSEIEGGLPATQVGCVRNFQIASGATIREKLLAISDEDYSVSYSIIETPLPISNHKATLTLKPVTDGNQTFAEWSATFDAPVEEADKLAAGMGENVFQGGFNALKEHFAKHG